MYIKEEVIWKKRENGSMLYNTRTEDRMMFNDIGSQVFLAKYINHFDEKDIAYNLNSKHKDQKLEDILEDVYSVLSDIEASEFITDDADKMGYINLLEADRQIDNAILKITGKCNLECAHCAEGGPGLTEEMATEQVFDLIEEFSMLKVFRLVITGGEPLLREDLAEVIKRCSEKNVRAIVFTNGTLVTEEFLNQIKGLNVLLRFSVDGANAKTHDIVRGEGSFYKTTGAMRLCRDMGVDTGLAATLTRRNFHQFLDILELATELGTLETEISEVLPVGNARSNSELLLSQEQLEQLRVYNFKLANENESFRRGMGFGNLVDFLLRTEFKREYPCNAGITTCFVDSDGSVYPCTLFKDYEELKCGNITGESFSDIWTGSPVLNTMRNLKISDIESCAGCESIHICPGGCRARAYAMTKRLDGPMEKEYCAVSLNVIQRLKAGEFDAVFAAKAVC